MNRTCLVAIAASFAACSLLVASAQAQEPKKPEPAPSAAPATDPAAVPDRRPGDTPDPKIAEVIVNCLAEGLSPDWKKAWFVVKEIDRNESTSTRQFEANFFYATKDNDWKGKRLKTCSGDSIFEAVGALNDYLTPEKQRWTSATFTITRDGRYDMKYDYTPVKPKPAAKPASKKKQESAK